MMPMHGSSIFEKRTHVLPHALTMGWTWLVVHVTMSFLAVAGRLQLSFNWTVHYMIKVSIWFYLKWVLPLFGHRLAGACEASWICKSKTAMMSFSLGTRDNGHGGTLPACAFHQR